MVEEVVRIPADVFDAFVEAVREKFPRFSSTPLTTVVAVPFRKTLPEALLDDDLTGYESIAVGKEEK